jgi:hypothetical protein
MSTFGGREVKEKATKYITPGVHEVTILKIEGTTSQSGLPMINISLHLKDGDSENANTFRIVMQKTNGEENEYSLKKLQHIATKVVTLESYLAVTGSNIEEYGQNLNDLLAGNSLRMKFTGEERLKTDGSGTTVISNIGLPDFAEAIQEGSEYPVVVETKLVYNPADQYDFKKLAVKPDVAPMFGSSETPNF